MKYIIVDLEATCWDTPDHGKVNEIIEIGSVLVEDGKIVKEFSVFIKPKLNPILSEFCTKLTSITQADVDGGLSFPEALTKFKEFIGEGDYCLASWGFYDKNQFEKDCKLHSLPTEWLKPHISIKHQYAEIKGLRKGPGVGKALIDNGMTFEGTPHRGIDDSKNITKLFFRYFDKLKFAPFQ